MQMSKSGNPSGRRACRSGHGDWNRTLVQDRGKAGSGMLWPHYASCPLSEPLLRLCAQCPWPGRASPLGHLLAARGMWAACRPSPVPGSARPPSPPAPCSSFLWTPTKGVLSAPPCSTPVYTGRSRTEASRFRQSLLATFY